jgi:hypothetical protein
VPMQQEDHDDDIDDQKDVHSPPPVEYLRCQWRDEKSSVRCSRFNVQSWMTTGQHPIEKHPIYDELKTNDQIERFCLDHLLGHWLERPQCRVRDCPNLISFRDLALDVGISDKCLLVNCQTDRLPHAFVHTRMACCPVPGCRGECFDTSRQSCKKAGSHCLGACIQTLDVESAKTVSLYHIEPGHLSIPLPYCFHHLGIQRNDLVKRYNVLPRHGFSVSNKDWTPDEVKANLVFDAFRPVCPQIDARLCRVQGCDLPLASTSLRPDSAFGVEFGRLECKDVRTHDWFHKTYDSWTKDKDGKPIKIVTPCESPFCGERGHCMRHEANRTAAHLIPSLFGSSQRLRNFSRLDVQSDRQVCAFHAWKHPLDFPKLCVVADCVMYRDKTSVFCDEHDKRARLQAMVEWFRERDRQLSLSSSPVVTITTPLVRRPSHESQFNNSVTQKAARMALLAAERLESAKKKEAERRQQANRAKQDHIADHEHQKRMDRIIHDRVMPNGVWTWLRQATEAEHRCAGLTKDDIAFLSRVDSAPKGSDDHRQKRELERLLPSLIRTDDRQQQHDVRMVDDDRTGERDGTADEDKDEEGTGIDSDDDNDSRLTMAFDFARDHEDDDDGVVADDSKHNFRPAAMARVLQAREQGRVFEDMQHNIDNQAMAARVGAQDGRLRVPADAFLRIRPFLDCSPTATIAEVDAIDRSTLKGSPADYDTNPFVVFMCAMLELLDRVTYDLQHPSIGRFTCLGWSTAKRLPPDATIELLPFLFDLQDLHDARRLVIAYCCIAAHGRFHGKKVSATSCFREYDKRRGTISSRGKSTTNSDAPTLTSSRSLNVMPEDVDCMAKYVEMLSSAQHQMSTSSVRGVGLQVAETLFVLVFASMMSAGRCPPINLFLRITTIYYTTCVVKDNHARLYGVADKWTENKMAGKFYELLQLVCCVIRGRLFHEASIELHNTYGVQRPSSKLITEGCWRWTTWLFSSDRRRALYVNTKYIETDTDGAGDHPFPRTSHKDLGTALGQMWDRLSYALHRHLKDNHPVIQQIQRDPRTAVDGKTHWTLCDVVLRLLDVLLEPLKKSNVALMRQWIATGHWTLPGGDDAMPTKRVRRSEAKVEAENAERKALDLPPIVILEKVTMPTEHKVGLKRKKTKGRDATTTPVASSSSSAKTKKDTPMVVVEAKDLAKEVCGFAQFVDAIEATELALSAVNFKDDLKEAWALSRRATAVFNTCMCGPKPDKPAVCILSFFVQALSKDNNANKHKRQKTDKTTTDEEDVEVEYPNPGKSFADYWIGIRSLNGVTMAQQKSVFCPTEGPVWNNVTKESFWVSLLYDDEEEKD